MQRLPVNFHLNVIPTLRLYLKTTIGKDVQREPQKSNFEYKTEAYSLEKVDTSCEEDRTG